VRCWLDRRRHGITFARLATGLSDGFRVKAVELYHRCNVDSFLVGPNGSRKENLDP